MDICHGFPWEVKGENQWDLQKPMATRDQPMGSIHSRSPRWSSGNPPMLLVLVHGDILNLFATILRDQLLRAPSVGKHTFRRESMREETAGVLSR